MNEKFKGCGCETRMFATTSNVRNRGIETDRSQCIAPRLVEALEMVKFYRESRMGASSSRLSQQYRAEMNDKIDAALAAAYGEVEG